jgi:TetR/AcrR family transcriptional repressor of nem operon
MKLNRRQMAKLKTRSDLTEAAAKILKVRGVEATSIDEVMASAGLTRGSFYAYFKSKDHMVSESLKFMMNETNERVKHQISSLGMTQENKLSSFLDFYLSEFHRDKVAEGCPVSALSRDLSQASENLRREFAKLLSHTIDDRRSFFSTDDVPIPRSEWIGIMSTYVGALVLSRACAGDNLSREILDGAKNILMKKVIRKST